MQTLRSDQVKAGDALPDLDVPITTTIVVGGGRFFFPDFSSTRSGVRLRRRSSSRQSPWLGASRVPRTVRPSEPTALYLKLGMVLDPC